MAALSNDFAPEVRNSAWWSGDSRKAANGKANEVILQKIGILPVKDISHIEAVRMGHVMEPVIGRLAQERLGVELHKVEESLTHKKHDWLRSHFDFVGVQNDKTILVEAKNYSMKVRNKFEDGIIPASDMAQLIHESAVYGVDTIYLAVLFGGQEFYLQEFNIDEISKDDLIKQMAEYWSYVVSKNPFHPEDTEQMRMTFPRGEDSTVTANKSIELACEYLKATKKKIAELEKEEERLSLIVMDAMQKANVLQSVSGEVLATWKNAKSSQKFDSKLFQEAMPDIYKQFMREVDGSRRFLIK